jgi:hypothetical protein
MLALVPVLSVLYERQKRDVTIGTLLILVTAPQDEACCCSVQEQGGGEVAEAGGSTATEEEGGKKTGLLEAIRLPLVSVFPRSKLKSTKVRLAPAISFLFTTSTACSRLSLI